MVDLKKYTFVTFRFWSKSPSKEFATDIQIKRILLCVSIFIRILNILGDFIKSQDDLYSSYKLESIALLNMFYGILPWAPQP